MRTELANITERLKHLYEELVTLKYEEQGSAAVKAMDAALGSLRDALGSLQDATDGTPIEHKAEAAAQLPPVAPDEEVLSVEAIASVEAEKERQRNLSPEAALAEIKKIIASTGASAKKIRESCPDLVAAAKPLLDARKSALVADWQAAVKAEAFAVASYYCREAQKPYLVRADDTRLSYGGLVLETTGYAIIFRTSDKTANVLIAWREDFPKQHQDLCAGEYVKMTMLGGKAIVKERRDAPVPTLQPAQGKDITR